MRKMAVILPFPSERRLVSAWQRSAAFMAKFLVTSFPDIAIGIVSSGSVETLENDGLQTFMQKVAEGKIKIR